MKSDHDISEILEPGGVDALPVYSCYVQTGVNGVHRLGTIQRYDRRFFVKSLVAEHVGDHLYRLRLRKEFKLLLELNHPGVIRVYELTDIPGLGLSILMEYMPGLTLAEWIDQPHSTSERHRVGEKLMDAVEYLHRNGVVHGDLKPANIMVSDDGSEVKLIDFGLGDTADYALLKAPGGTLGYSAPEQFKPGYESSSTADIYSLGGLLRDLGYSGTWHSVIRRCLSVDPEQRPESVAAMRRRAHRWRVPSIVMGCLLALGGVYAVISWLVPVKIVERRVTETKHIVSPGKADTVVKMIRDTSVVASPTPAVEIQHDTVMLVDLKKLPVPDEAQWIARRDKIDNYVREEIMRYRRELDSSGLKPGTDDYRFKVLQAYSVIMHKVSNDLTQLRKEAPHEMEVKYGTNWFSFESLKSYKLYEEFCTLAEIID